MRTIQDLSKEELDKLEWIMLHACKSNDPWADMMYLGGSGDEPTGQFPFGLDEIEQIDISFVPRGETPEIGETSGAGQEGAMAGQQDGAAEQKSASSEKTGGEGDIGIEANVDVNLNLGGVGGLLKDTLGAAKEVLPKRGKRDKSKDN